MDEDPRRRKSGRFKNMKKVKKRNMAAVCYKKKEEQLVFIRNQEEKRRKPTLKPQFVMNPTTMMVDKGK
nr:hypothetical protein [Tanacetum cinerariifolium]